MRADVAHHQRVAVGLGARGVHGGDRAAAARRVLDEERLAEGALQLVGDGAADQVEAAAGLRGNDDPHRLGGVALRQAAERKRDQQE